MKKILSKRNLLLKAKCAVPVLTAIASSVAPIVAHAESSTAAATDVAAATTVFTSGLAIFGEYPMNIYIGASLLCAGLGVFGVAKGVSRY